MIFIMLGIHAYIIPRHLPFGIGERLRSHNQPGPTFTQTISNIWNSNQLKTSATQIGSPAQLVEPPTKAMPKPQSGSMPMAHIASACSKSWGEKTWNVKLEAGSEHVLMWCANVQCSMWHQSILTTVCQIFQAPVFTPQYPYLSVVESFT